MSDLAEDVSEDDYWMALDSRTNAYDAATEGDIAAGQAVRAEGGKGLIPASLRLDSTFAYKRADQLEKSLAKMSRRGRSDPGLEAQVEGYRADGQAIDLADQVYAMFTGQARLAAGAVARMEATSATATPMTTELDDIVAGKSKAMKAGAKKVAGREDEDVDSEQIAFTGAQRSFARGSSELLAALQGDIPFFLRAGAKEHKDQHKQLEGTVTQVKALAAELRGNTGALVGTASAAGMSYGTAFSANLVDQKAADGALATCTRIEQTLAAVAPYAEAALDRFHLEVRNFRAGLEQLREQGARYATVLATQRRLLVDAGQAADRADTSTAKRQNHSLTSTLVAAGSIEEGKTVLDGAIDIARSVKSEIEQAEAQILSHRNTAFKSTRGGRAKADGVGGGDVGQLAQAAKITEDWVTKALASQDAWAEAESSASEAIQRSGVSGGDY
jgi:hypothetical protein